MNNHTIQLAQSAPSVLACGAWLKNTVCLTHGNQAYLSCLIGDLDSVEKRQKLVSEVERLCRELDVMPQLVLHDLHPDFYSTQFAQEFAAQYALPTLSVQHHHAHIAAVCAEHHIQHPVLGLALDGVGLGDDNTSWGGELLYVDGAEFKRLGHLAYLPMPGGDKAAQEPWRMAAAVLHQFNLNDQIVTHFAQQPAAQTVAHMLQRKFNCPATSSAGRLFDAVAGLLKVNEVQTFEAQAAIALQKLATQYGDVEPMLDGFIIHEHQRLDFSPLLRYLLTCHDVAYGSALFHATLAKGLATLARYWAQQLNLQYITLGGGCFHNEILLRLLHVYLAEFRVLQAAQVPPSDASIALGQAWVGIQKQSL